MNSNSGSRQNYNSVKEVRYFCERGGPTIEGSTPISSLATQPKNHEETMYAVKNKDGLFLTEDGKYVSDPDIHKIKWYKWYLHAEESTCGTSDTVIAATAVMETIIAAKDLEIASLKLQVKMKTEACDMMESMYVSKRKQHELMKHTVVSLQHQVEKLEGDEVL